MKDIKVNINKLANAGMDVESILYSLKFFLMLEMLTGHDKTYRKYKHNLKNELLEHYRDEETCDTIIMKLTQSAGNQISETFLNNALSRRKINVD